MRPRPNAKTMSALRFAVRVGIDVFADSLRPIGEASEHAEALGLAAAKYGELRQRLLVMDDLRRSAPIELQDLLGVGCALGDVFETLAASLGFNPRQLYNAPIGRYDRDAAANVLRCLVGDQLRDQAAGLAHRCKGDERLSAAAANCLASLQEAVVRLRNHDDGPMAVFVLLWRAAQLLAPLDRPRGLIVTLNRNAAIDARRQPKQPDEA